MARLDDLRLFNIRLQGELNRAKNLSSKEILSLLPVENGDVEHWEAKIQGPTGTPYENGVFAIRIHITRTPDRNGALYPIAPPKMQFKTKIFHPNISSEGEICLDILYEQYNISLGFEKLLLCIVALLSDPNTEDFLEPEAAYLYKENREEYDRIAREWTQKYAMTVGDDAEAQENINELSNLNDTAARDNMSSSSDRLVEQESIDIQPSGRCRSARFSIFEPLKAKTFDNGRSKESLLIVAQCFMHDNNQSKTNSYEMYDFNESVIELDMNKELQSLIVEIGEEGIKLGKEIDSERLINELCPLIDAPPDEIGQGCLRLYSMNTFLYYQFNQFLREADPTRIETYGSFVRLLYFYFNHSWSIEVYDTEVYRGMNLSSSMINEYKKVANSCTSFRWAAFSSATIDISPYSEYPEEEEILLKPGVGFTVENVKYDSEKKKHYIDLNVYV